jgi:hypothetical protein
MVILFRGRGKDGCGNIWSIPSNFVTCTHLTLSPSIFTGAITLLLAPLVPPPAPPPPQLLLLVLLLAVSAPLVAAPPASGFLLLFTSVGCHRYAR